MILILALIFAKMAESPDTEALVSGWVGLLVIGFYLLNIIIIGKSVLQSKSLLDDRVYGGIAVYMLIAIMFAVIHHRIGVRTVDAYKNVAMTDAGPLNWARLHLLQLCRIHHGRFRRHRADERLLPMHGLARIGGGCAVSSDSDRAPDQPRLCTRAQLTRAGFSR